MRSPDATPVLLRELIVSERLHRAFRKLGGFGQAQCAQLVDHSDSLLARRHNVLAGMDRLEHGRDLAHLSRRHVAEDVAVPMHHGAVEKA